MIEINKEKQTWLIISAFLLIIVLISLITEKFSLADIGTFGLMIIALQALYFTRKQLGEWRRKDAASTCSTIETEFRNIAKKSISFRTSTKALEASKYYNKPLEADQNKIQKLTINLEIINEHFKSLNKPSIKPAIDLLRAYSVCNHYFHTLDDPLDGYLRNEDFQYAVSEFNSCWIKFEEHAIQIKSEKIKAEGIEILLYLDNLKLVSISD